MWGWYLLYRTNPFDPTRRYNFHLKILEITNISIGTDKRNNFSEPNVIKKTITIKKNTTFCPTNVFVDHFTKSYAIHQTNSWQINHAIKHRIQFGQPWVQLCTTFDKAMYLIVNNSKQLKCVGGRENLRNRVENWLEDCFETKRNRIICEIFESILCFTLSTNN